MGAYQPSLVPGNRPGNVSLAMDANDELVAQARYEPNGKLCWNGDTVIPTDYAFTSEIMKTSQAGRGKMGTLGMYRCV